MSLASLAICWLSPALQLATPTASAVQAEPLAVAVSADQSLAFVAEGATIAVLGMSPLQNPPPAYAHIPLPGATPMAIQPYGNRLYVAGGSLGLWRLDLCSSLVSAPHTTCTCTCADPYDRQLVDDVGEKVCIDLAYTKASWGTRYVAALYAAQGANELRIYGANTGTLVSSLALTSGTPSDAIGYAISAEAPISDSFYVALGTGGLVRVDLANSGGTISASMAQGPVFAASLGSGRERVRDVAVVTAFSPPVRMLYATLDYGSIAELDVSLHTGWSSATPTLSPTSCTSPGLRAFASRIAAAVSSDGTRIAVAVGTQDDNVLVRDHGAPFTPNGVWDADLGVGIVDPNVHPTPCTPSTACDPQLQVYTRTAAAALAHAFTLPAERWTGLVLTNTANSVFRSCEATLTGFRAHEFDPFSVPVTFNATIPSHIDVVDAPLDGEASLLKPELLLLGTDPAGGVSAGMSMATSAPGFTHVPNTLYTGPGGATAALCSGGRAELNPYLDSGLGSAQWVDPLDPTHREWFFSGRKSLVRQVDAASCTSEPSCYLDPWDALARYQAQQLLPPTLPSQSGGWFLTSFEPQVADGATWNLRYWRVASLTNHAMKPGVYAYASEDPRVSSGLPMLLHATRASHLYGYVVFRTRQLVNQANAAFASCGAGKGEELVPAAGDWTERQTHFEFDDGCAFSSCPPTLRALLTTRVEVFSVTDGSGGTHWVSAVCAGAALNASQPSCGSSPNWPSYYHAPMVVFYELPSSANLSLIPSTPLSIALGTDFNNPADPPLAGSAFAIETRVINGTPYAFVADFMGRLWVFDVSWGQLTPGTNPLDPVNHLRAVNVITFPVHPFDQQPSNAIDLEIDGNYAYVALTRTGVAIVDISNPLASAPPITYVDTPGLAEGLVLTAVGGLPSMVVSQPRAGLQLFQ